MDGETEIKLRELDGHKVNPVNDVLRVIVNDAPGAGGANHRYEIYGFDMKHNPSAGPDLHDNRTVILFQNGPIAEAGVNGLTHEVLLEILIDRLAAFQAGPYACDENAKALRHVREAKNYLQARTKARMARNVEGTHTV